MSHLDPLNTTNSDDTASLLSLSGLPTPKIQPLPLIETISTGLEKRHSLIGRNIPASILNTHPSSTKGTPTSSTSFQNPALNSLYIPKTWPSSEKPKMLHNQNKNNIEARVLRVGVDRLIGSDIEEFLNSSGGYSHNGSSHKNTPVAVSYKKNSDSKSRFSVPIFRGSTIGNDFSKEEKASEDFARLCGSDSHRGEKRDSGRVRTPKPILPPHNGNPHYYNFQSDFELLSARESGNKNKDSLLNEVVLDKILRFLDCMDVKKLSQVCVEFRQQKRYKSKFKKCLNELLSKGIATNQQQYLFWDSFIDFKGLKLTHPTSFTQNFVRKCKYIKDIRLDVDRTFPEYDKYSTEEGKSSLLRVLVAVSNSFAEVGYVQGMNSISAVFLFYIKEEQSFWATIYLLEKLKVKDILNDGFKTVHLLNYQFETFLHAYLPKVSKHLKFQSITMSYITTPWFITLYSYVLPLPLTVKLWNFLFIRGYSFLLQFALAIFSRYQAAILEMEPDEVPIYLKSELKELSEHDETIFRKALELKVTKKLRKDLAYYYENGKPELVLERSMNNKLRWERAENSIQPKIQPYVKKSITRGSQMETSQKSTMIIDHRRKYSCDTLSSLRSYHAKSQNIFNVIKANFPEKPNTPMSFESKRSQNAIESLNFSTFSKAQINEQDRTPHDQDILHLLERTTISSKNNSETRNTDQSHYQQADLYVDHRIQQTTLNKPFVSSPKTNPEQYLTFKRSNTSGKPSTLAPSWGTAALSAERHNRVHVKSNISEQHFERPMCEEKKLTIDNRYFSINPLVKFDQVSNAGDSGIPKTLVTLDAVSQKGRNPFKKSESFNIRGRNSLYNNP